MVKGSTRQVVVVKSPGEKIFEQAIFLLKEDAASLEGVSDSELLKQAREACRQDKPTISGWLERVFWFCCGAATVVCLWLFLTVL